MPSLAEGMPLAMIEAMSVGLPVISTPWTGVSALLGRDEYGTTLTDWEPQTTARALHEFIQSPIRHTMKAQRAMNFVRKNHDIERCARAHEDWYRTVAWRRGIAVS
jgi:glycosyltransferase involved in cell wall biosynthesis